MPTQPAKTTLSDEELEALHSDSVSQTDEPPSPYGVDTWFKYRHAYLLVVIFFYVVKLLFFTENTVSQFTVHPDDKVTLIRYIQLRAFFVMVLTCFYIWSYLKNWRFEKVALILAVISVTSFVMDYFNAYMYLNESAVPFVSWLFVLRCLVVACLVLNAFNAARAPLMPRTLWN